MNSALKYIHFSWQDVENSCLSIYAAMKAKGYLPDVIVGLLWGGVVPTRIFVDLFGVKRLDAHVVYASLYNGIDSTNDKVEIIPYYCKKDIEGKKVLIVDDIFESGRTMHAALRELLKEKCWITTATLVYKSETNSISPDYYDKVINSNDIWAVFPWENREFFREISGTQ
jgi:hypoxanthine phosphoribosyltransferase